jgi:hypothetical protein
MREPRHHAGQNKSGAARGCPAFYFSEASFKPEARIGSAHDCQELLPARSAPKIYVAAQLAHSSIKAATNQVKQKKSWRGAATENFQRDPQSQFSRVRAPQRPAAIALS